MPSSLAIRFMFIALLFSVGLVSAEQTVSSSQSNQPTLSNTQLPEWVYRELISIRQDVSVLDAESVSDQQIQELKERIGVLETEVKFSESRIGDIYASTDRFGIIAGILGAIIAVIAFIFSSNAKREAIASAKDTAQKITNDWIENRQKKFEEQIENEIEKLNSSIKEGLSIQLLRMKLNEGLALIGSGREKESLSLIDEVIDAVCYLKTKEGQLLMGKALISKSHALRGLNRPNEVIEIYNTVLDRFSGAKEIESQEFVAISLAQKTIQLIELNRHREVVEVCSNLVERFKNSIVPKFQGMVASSLARKGDAYKNLEDLNLAEAAFSEAIQFIRERQSDETELWFAYSLMNKAILLQKRGSLEETYSTCNELIDIFQNNEGEDIKHFVLSAINMKKSIDQILK